MSTQTTVAGTGCWNRTASYNARPTRSWTAPMFASMYPSLTVLLRHDFSAKKSLQEPVPMQLGWTVSVGRARVSGLRPLPTLLPG
jgi:hypothetical protein